MHIFIFCTIPSYPDRRLDPSVDDIAHFPTVRPQRRTLSYALKQLVSHEIDLQRMRREEGGGGPPPAAAAAASAKESRKADPTRSVARQQPGEQQKEEGEEEEATTPRHLQRLQVSMSCARIMSHDSFVNSGKSRAESGTISPHCRPNDSTRAPRNAAPSTSLAGQSTRRGRRRRPPPAPAARPPRRPTARSSPATSGSSSRKATTTPSAASSDCGICNECELYSKSWLLKYILMVLKCYIYGFE